MVVVRRLIVAALLGACGWLVVETFRLSESLGRRDVELRVEHRRSEDLQRALDDAEALGRRVRQLYDAALDQNHALGEVLTAVTEENERNSVQRATEVSMAMVPAPPGVTACLDALSECLRNDGYSCFRILRAAGLVDGELRDLEFLELDPAGQIVEVIVAASMSATVHRDRAELILTFRDGLRRAMGVRASLPENGYDLRLPGVDGAMWERRVPALVRGKGQYPPSDADRRAADRVDPVTRAEWADRLALLFDESGLDLRLRIAGFRGMRGGRFLDARLHGYDRSNLLQLTCDCAELAVEVDERAGVVSLLMCSGLLRQEGQESTIHADGYRMLLPRLTPKRASDLMLGMVVTK